MVLMLHYLYMARTRILLPNGGCYHAWSRIVDRSWRFGSAEKEFFVATLRRLEAFLDVKVLTYCVMSNHFHLLLELPEPEKMERLTVESLLRRLPLLYHGRALAAARDEIIRAEAHRATPTGTSTWIDSIVARYQARMGDLSVFLKELKWRFSRWYNACNDRVGTLWEDRFHSMLVEGDEHALMTIAAYIDLNPVRAGISADPADHRWSGYGEAAAGERIARSGLARLHGRVRAWQGEGRAPVTWTDIAASYRCYLFGRGQRRLGDGRTGIGAKRGIEPETVERVTEQEKGEIPLHEALRKRVRYFCKGVVLGSAAFVNQFSEGKSPTGESSRSTPSHSPSARASPMHGADWNGLTTLRTPRRDRTT